MNKLFILGLSAACMALAACSTATKEKLGLTKKAPNEFWSYRGLRCHCRRNMT